MMHHCTLSFFSICSFNKSRVSVSYQNHLHYLWQFLLPLYLYVEATFINISLTCLSILIWLELHNIFITLDFIFHFLLRYTKEIFFVSIIDEPIMYTKSCIHHFNSIVFTTVATASIGVRGMINGGKSFHCASTAASTVGSVSDKCRFHEHQNMSVRL